MFLNQKIEKHYTVHVHEIYACNWWSFSVDWESLHSWNIMQTEIPIIMSIAIADKSSSLCQLCAQFPSLLYIHTKLTPGQTLNKPMEVGTLHVNTDLYIYY